MFERVSFSYPGNPRPVLDDLSFSIRRDECLALVGHNGAGKTTIVKLLLRLYDPSAGRVLLDGVDLREYDLEDLRREIGAVFQDFVRFELTARENIGLGDLRAMRRFANAVSWRPRPRPAPFELLEKLPARTGYLDRSGVRRSRAFRRRVAEARPCPRVHAR